MLEMVPTFSVSLLCMSKDIPVLHYGSGQNPGSRSTWNIRESGALTLNRRSTDGNFPAVWKIWFQTWRVGCAANSFALGDAQHATSNAKHIGNEGITCHLMSCHNFLQLRCHLNSF